MRVDVRAVCGLAFLTLAPAMFAQAPKITSRGDPSVRDDTIYALAANPAERANSPAVTLFEDVVLRVEPNGRYTRTVRTVTQVFREQDVPRFAEQTLTYANDHEGLTINWVRVLKPTGELINDKPTHPAETDSPRPVVNRFYRRERVHRIVLTGVAPGTIVDISYTKEEKGPYRPGDHYYGWSVGAPQREVLRSRFIYDVPASLKPVITERDVPVKAVVTEGEGRRTYTWALHPVPRFTGEPFAPDSLNRIPRVSVSLPNSWAEIGKFYADVGRGLYDVGGDASDKLRAAVGRARTFDDTVRNIHKWIANDISPATGVTLGLGPYKVRPAIETSADGQADAKDKVQIFVGSMMTVKIEAFPVLTHLTGDIETTNPSIQQFNHVIAAVKKRDGAYVFTDVTRGDTKYGELPLDLQGSFALIVKPNGDVEEVHLPRTAAASRKSETTINATLSEAGTMSGTISDQRFGDGWEQVRRQAGVITPDSARRAAAMQAHLARFQGARGSEYIGFDGRDFNALISYTTTFSGARVSAPGTGGDVLTVPFQPTIVSPQIAALSRGERTKPFDANRMLANATTRQELTLTLPAGWKARLPAEVVAESDFGKYRATYSQVGAQLKIVRTIEPGQGTFPASRLPDVVAWLTAIRADEANRTILLEHPPK